MSNPYEHYLEQSVLNASPLELVRLLYRFALDSIGQARECLASGDVAGRARPVSKTCDALTELLISLNHDKGGDFSRSLQELYGYMQHRILQGHIEQADCHFAEVEKLLSNLLEAWQAVEADTPVENLTVLQPAAERAYSLY